MHYTRTFWLQVSHFNDGRTYENYASALQDFAERRHLDSVTRLLEVVADIHGHNMRVDVTITGQLGLGRDWLVDDPEIERVVMAFDNKNLSVIAPFGKSHRATTENIAAYLKAQLENKNPGMTIKVRVWETNLIHAEA
jgi:6-pyruvoyl-tetrahydropterin synthase